MGTPALIYSLPIIMEDYNHFLANIIFIFSVLIIQNTQANPIAITSGSKFHLRHAETNHFIIGMAGPISHWILIHRVLYFANLDFASKFNNRVLIHVYVIDTLD